MEKQFIKELDHTYLLLADDHIDEDEYILQMALRGKLPGILPVRIAARDGRKSLRADVTACTSIASRYKSMDMPGHDMRRILTCIRDTAMKMPSLLMSVRDLWLDPECIFLSSGGDEVLLCYIPHLSDSDPDTVMLLSEFLLKKLDHNDQIAARLAYSFYDQVSSSSCVLNDVLSNLIQESRDTAQDSRPEGTSGSGAHLSGSRPPGVRPVDTRPSGTRPSGTASAAAHPAGTRPQVCGSMADTVPDDSRRRHAEADIGSPSFESDFEELSGMHTKKACGRNANAAGHNAGFPGRKAKTAGHSAGRSDSYKKKKLPSGFIPAIIIIPAACIIALFFRMDLTQIMGMGFLCAALIWIIHISTEKRENEGRNAWFDDDMESDDEFYQSLRDELYARPAYSPDNGSRQAPEYGSKNEYAGGSANESEERTTLLGKNKPVLVSLQGGSCPDILIERDHMIVGKSRSQADVILPGNTISRRHARIERRTDGYYVTDMFSTNGTFLDGHRLESGQAVALKDGAQLTFASLHYRVSM